MPHPSFIKAWLTPAFIWIRTWNLQIDTRIMYEKITEFWQHFQVKSCRMKPKLCRINISSGHAADIMGSDNEKETKSTLIMWKMEWRNTVVSWRYKAVKAADPSVSMEQKFSQGRGYQFLSEHLGLKLPQVALVFYSGRNTFCPQV